MEHEREPTLRDLIEAVRRGLLTALLSALIVSATVYFVSQTFTPMFEAQATVVTSTQDPSQRDFGTTLVTAPPLAADAYVVAIASHPVLAEALFETSERAPNDAAVDALVEALQVRADSTNTSSLIRILVRDPSPVSAQDLANAIANAAVRWDQNRATRSLETIIDSLSAQIASVDAELVAGTEASEEGLLRARADLALQLSSARALRSGAVGRLELLEAAGLPREPVSPRPTRNAAVAGMLAVLFTYGALLLRDVLDNRVRNLDDLVRVTGVPVLSEFPRVTGGRRKLPKEAASYLRTAVSFATASDSDPKVLLVTSTGAGHGKSSVSMALAESFSRQQYKVLLIDADLRQAVLGTEYGIDAGRYGTVRDALVDPPAVAPITVALGRELTLDLLPSFYPVHNPTELLANHMRGLLEYHAPDYDVIVIDCAPVLPVADALTVAPHTTGVVFAVSMPDADRRQVGAAIDLLRRVGVRILGMVATNLPSGHRGRGAYGYGYGFGTEAVERTPTNQPPPKQRSVRN